MKKHRVADQHSREVFCIVSGIAKAKEGEAIEGSKNLAGANSIDSTQKERIVGA